MPTFRLFHLQYVPGWLDDTIYSVIQIPLFTPNDKFKFWVQQSPLPLETLKLFLPLPKVQYSLDIWFSYFLPPALPNLLQPVLKEYPHTNPSHWFLSSQKGELEENRCYFFADDDEGSRRVRLQVMRILQQFHQRYRQSHLPSDRQS